MFYFAWFAMTFVHYTWKNEILTLSLSLFLYAKRIMLVSCLPIQFYKNHNIIIEFVFFPLYHRLSLSIAI